MASAESLDSICWQEKAVRKCDSKTLLCAAFHGDKRGALACLRDGVFVDCTDKDGNTPLLLAVKYGHTKVCRILLANGANVHHQNHSGLSSIFLAVQHNHIQVCVFLIATNANINEINKDGDTPLHVAARRGRDNISELLLAAKANAHATNKKFQTALHIAANYGHIKVCRALYVANAIVDAQDENGRTPLHFAAREGHKYVCQKLLEEGADKNKQDNFGHSPLYYAFRNYHLDVYQVLRADTDNQTRVGITALPKTVQNNHCALFKLLLIAGLNARIRGQLGNIAFHAEWDKKKISQQLTTPDTSGKTQSKMEKTPIDRGREDEEHKKRHESHEEHKQAELQDEKIESIDETVMLQWTRKHQIIDSIEFAKAKRRRMELEPVIPMSGYTTKNRNRSSSDSNIDSGGGGGSNRGSSGSGSGSDGTVLRCSKLPRLRIDESDLDQLARGAERAFRDRYVHDTDPLLLSLLRPSAEFSHVYGKYWKSSVPDDGPSVRVTVKVSKGDEGRVKLLQEYQTLRTLNSLSGAKLNFIKAYGFFDDSSKDGQLLGVERSNIAALAVEKYVIEERNMYTNTGPRPFAEADVVRSTGDHKIEFSDRFSRAKKICEIVAAMHTAGYAWLDVHMSSFAYAYVIKGVDVAAAQPAFRALPEKFTATAAYMAPELAVYILSRIHTNYRHWLTYYWHSQSQFDLRRCDSWSLGVLLWALFDKDGHSYMKRAHSLNANNELYIINRLEQLSQDSVDGHIDKYFTGNTLEPLRCCLRSLLKVDPSERITLNELLKMQLFHRTL